MHLTVPTTTCSMWTWKIIRAHSSSSTKGSLPKMLAISIWRRFAGQKDSFALNACTMRLGRRRQVCINAGNASGGPPQLQVLSSMIVENL